MKWGLAQKVISPPKSNKYEDTDNAALLINEIQVPFSD